MSSKSYQPIAPQRVAFLGLGTMGAPMARNLLKAGHRLTVFDPLPASVAALVEAGAQAADSAGAVARAGVEALRSR